VARIASGTDPVLSLAIAPAGNAIATGTRRGAVEFFDFSRPYPINEWAGIPAAPTSLQVSSDSRYVLTGDAGGTLRWWDSQTKAAARDFAGTTAPLVGAALLESAGAVYSLGGDGGVRQWKLADGQLAGTVLTPLAASFAVASDGKSVFVGGQDGWVRKVEWPPAAPQPLGAHNDAATSVVLSPDGQLIASGGVDARVLLYQTADGKNVRALADGPGRITSVAFSADNSRLIAAGEAGGVKVWNVADGVPTSTHGGHTGAVIGLAAHPKVAEFATAGADGTVRFWRLTPSPQALAGHTQPALRVALSPDGKSAWSVSNDRTLRGWTTADGKLARTVEKLPASPGPLAVSGDGRWSVLGDAAGDLSTWSTADGAPQLVVGAHLAAITAVARDPQGPGWLTAGADGMLKLWSGPPAAAELLAGLPAAAGLIAVSGDGKTLVASQPEGTIVVLDVAGKKPRHSWTSPKKSAVTALAVSADGNQVWAADQTGLVRGWNLADGTQVGWFWGGPEVVAGLGWNAREPLAATATADGEIRIWRTETARKTVVPAAKAAAVAPAAIPPGNAAPANNAVPAVAAAPNPLPLAASADGLVVASAQADGAIHWLTVADAKPIRGPLSVNARPTAIAIRPDGGELSAGDVTGRLSVAGAGQGAPLTRLKAHEGELTGLSYHSAGAQVASAGGDGMVRVWQLPFQTVQSVAKLPAAAETLATSTDGQRVYVTNFDRKLRAFEIATGNVLYQVDSGMAPTTAIAVSADNLAVAVADAGGGVSVRGAADGVLALRLHAHTGAARGVAFPPRPAPWVSVGDDGVLRVWDIPAAPRVLSGHTGAVESVTLSPNGATIATTGVDKAVRLWGVADGAPGWTLAHDMPIRTLAWRGDAQQLATADAGQKIRVWNLADGQQSAILEGHAAAVQALVYAPDGTLFSGGADGQVKLWNVAEKKETASLDTGAPVVGMSIVAATSTLVTAHGDGTIKTWQLADRKALAAFAAGAPIERFALTADGKTVLVGCVDKSIRQFALAGGAAGPTAANLPAAIRSVAWSADGQRFAATLADGAIRVWTAAGELVEDFDLGATVPSGLVFTPDGKSVVVGSDDRQVRIAKLLALRKITASPQPLTSVAFSIDAATVATGGRDKSVGLWNVASGAAVRVCVGAADAITSVAISPDGQKVLATARDKQLRVWTLASGQIAGTYPLPFQAVGVRISRDGLRAAVTDEDGSVRVIDIATGRVLQVLEPLATTDVANAAVLPNAPAPMPLAQAAANAAPNPPAPNVAVPAVAHFGADNATVVYATRDMAIAKQTVSAVAAFPAHPAGFTRVIWAPNGQHLLTAGVDKAIKMHDLQGRVIATMAGGEFDVAALALRRDGLQTAAVTRDGHLVFWLNANGQQERKLPLPAPATALAYSTDQTRVIAANASEYSVLVAATGRLVEAGPLTAAAPKAAAPKAAAPNAAAPNAAAPNAAAPNAVVAPSGIAIAALAAPAAPAGAPAPATNPTPLHFATLDASGHAETRSTRLERVLTGHTGAVTSCVFTPDGLSVISGGIDKTVRLWTLATGQSPRSFAGPTDAVTGVAVSGDGTRVAAVSADKSARVWNTMDGAVVSTVTVPAALRRIALSPSGTRFSTSGDDQIVRLFDFATGREIQHWTAGGTLVGLALADSGRPHWSLAEGGLRADREVVVGQWLADAAKVLAASWLPDGKQIVTCGEDRTVKIWNRDGTLAKSLTQHPVPPTCLAVRPDGGMIAVGGQVGAAYASVSLWRTSDGAAVPALNTPAGVAAIAWSADGRLAVAGVDQHLRIYGQDPLVLLEDITLGANAIDLAFSADGRQLWVASADNQVRVLAPSCYRLIAAHPGAATGVAYVADGRLLVTIGSDKSLRLWDAKTGRWLAQGVGSPASLTSMAATADGRRVAAFGGDGQIRVWSLEKPLAAVPAPKPDADKPDAAPAATAGTPGAPANASPTAAAPPLEVPVLGAWATPSTVRSLAWNATGTRLASAHEDTLVRLWQVAAEAPMAPAPPADFAKELQRWAGHTGIAMAVAFDSEGQRVVSASADKSVTRWSIATRTALKAHEGNVIESRLTADGKRLFTAGADKLIRAWDTAMLAAPQDFPGTSVGIKGLAASADGRVVVAGDDTFVRAWTGVDGKRLAELKLPAAVASVDVSADGQRVIVSTADNVIRHLRLEKAGEMFELRPFMELKGPASPAVRLTLGPDQRVLYSAHADQQLRAWMCASPEARWTATEHSRPVYAIGFSVDGKRLASGGGDGKAVLWDMEAGKPVASAESHPRAVHAIAFAPSGKELATTGADSTIRLWDPELKPLEKISVGVAGQQHTLAYSADSSQLFTGGADRVWQSFQRSSLLRTRNVDGHNDTVYKLAFNPAGNRIATVDYSGHVVVWDVSSGGVLFHQQLPQAPAFSLAYSPDGVELAVATRDPRVMRLTVPPAAR
jgi:WD40 repeat protein